MEEKSVFISYGGNIDKGIAKLLAEYLVKLIGRESVYCTALLNNTNGPAYGEDFAESYMKNIKDTKIFIQLLSPNYLGSPTALIEMGAAYALGKHIFPFIVSGGDYSQLQRLYNARNREMFSIENKKGVIKALHSLESILDKHFEIDEDDVYALLNKIKALDTQKRTLLSKSKELSFVCDGLFANPEGYQEIINWLGRKKIINICVNKIEENKIVSSNIYLYDNKTIEDFRNALEDKGIRDFEINPIEG